MWPFGAGSTSDTPAQQDTADACPVDEGTRKAWLASKSDKDSGTSPSSNAAFALLNAKPEAQKTVTVNASSLSTDRVVSSIPRWIEDKVNAASAGKSAAVPADSSSSSNWVYPSPRQFFNAMARKDHNPRADDMNVVVPIHNAVNERAWGEILQWERTAGEDSWKTCGGPKLVSFKGRPKDVTWKAWGRSLLGYQLPFDRHDWEVDRCGRRVRYVIDFYTGRSDGRGPSGLSFYLDVRPSPSDLEGWRMRTIRVWNSLFAA